MKTWLIGLTNAAISGFTSGGVSWAVGGSLKQNLAIAGSSALVSVIKWLAQHPIQ
jgi:hypothetical protein